MSKLCGYTGKILRVDLSRGKQWIETLDESILRNWIGGTGLGAKILWEEVAKEVSWDSAENRLVFATGPLTGTGFNGAGGFSVVGKGPMTNEAGCSQANGFFGAYLKLSGFDAVVFEGISQKWVYLVVKEGTGFLEDASHLRGKDTFQTEELLRRDLNEKARSIGIVSVGPAAENLVRFACVMADGGHIASKNGLGAVMGKKRLKAIVAYRGKRTFSIFDDEVFQETNRRIIEASKKDFNGIIYNWGTGGLVTPAYETGVLPVKNYTTNLFSDHQKLDARYTRKQFKIKNDPCYACRVAHSKVVTVTEGEYKGLRAPEPEYEILAAFGPMIGQSDAGAVVHLNTLNDGLGMDGNEMGWIMGFVMEAFERGIISQEFLDGLDMRWGNVRSVEKLIKKIAYREGVGDLLADGVMRASIEIGGKAPELAIHSMNGTTPRGHDHRGRWAEMFDTCLSNTSTIEATFGGPNPQLYGYPPPSDSFSTEEIPLLNAKVNGMRQLDDSLVICRFAANNPKLILESLRAVTGWKLGIEDAMIIGKRIVNLLRLFNFRHGHSIESEAPSPRYGSSPSDGPWKGITIRPHWEKMRKSYYEHMGWDIKTGKPLPETLKNLGLEDAIK